jgi:predicted CoA-binding protein
MSVQSRIDAFLAQDRFAVAGASGNRAKYGNKCLRCYQQHGRDVVAIHPKETEVEGAPAYPRLADVPETPQALSIVTPHPVTERLVEEAAAIGVQHVWMQPGAESEPAVRRAEELGLNVISGGPCLLVALGFRDE